MVKKNTVKKGQDMDQWDKVDWGDEFERWPSQTNSLTASQTDSLTASQTDSLTASQTDSLTVSLTLTD